MTGRNSANRLSRSERDLLMVAYHYPPADHAGTRRVTAFTRYLPECGYQPTILTTNARGRLPSDAAQRIVRADEIIGLLARPYRALRLRNIPKQERANAVAVPADSWVSRMLNKWLIPDMHATWYPLAVRRGMQILRERPIQLLFSTSPPATGHLVALRLKQLTGLPWVADFRDGWMFEPPNPAPFSSPLRTQIEHGLERRVVLGADRIVTVNQTIADDLVRRYPAAAGRIVVISNGYDPEMFYALERQPRSDGRFRLVYTGTLSLSETNRSIAGFLAALQELLMAGHPLMHDLQIELVGSLAAAEQVAIRQAGLAPYFTYTGSVPYRTALQHQLDADVLLLVTASTATSVTTSKLFEYLASARPILALTGRSAAAEVIRELDAGVVVEPNDPAAIKQALIGLHQRWQAGTLSSQQDPRVARFSRPHLTEQLAGAFDQLLGERP